MDPLDDSAPLHVLMSLRGNPALAAMTDEEITKTITTFRGLAAPQSLATKVKSEKADVKTKKKTAVQNLLDLL